MGSFEIRRVFLSVTFVMVVALAMPSGASGAVFVDVRATDVQSSFTAGTNIFTTSTGGEGQTVSPSPPSLTGKTFHVDMVLSGAETAGTVGTRFVGTNDGLADVRITDGATLLLALDINFIDVTSAADQFGFFTVVNFGAHDLGFTTNELVVVGGTLADDFGGIGSLANLFVDVTFFGSYVPGSVFSSNFTTTAANYDVFIDPPSPSPEPASLALMGLGLGWLARHRARRGAR